MAKALRFLLWIRYFVGCVWARQEWHVRQVGNGENLRDIIAWTNEMKSQGWEDFAAVGSRLYLRRFHPRWPAPTPPAPPQEVSRG